MFSINIKYTDRGVTVSFKFAISLLPSATVLTQRSSLSFSLKEPGSPKKLSAWFMAIQQVTLAFRSCLDGLPKLLSKLIKGLHASACSDKLMAKLSCIIAIINGGVFKAWMGSHLAS